MELGYAANDFPAIARRMREISNERKKAEEDQGLPDRSANIGRDRLRRSPSEADDSRRNWRR